MAKAHVDIQLRWGDQDAYGHVNNATVFRLLEEARVRLFWHGNAREETGLEGHFRFGDSSDVLTLVASHNIQYVRVLEYSQHPATVEIWLGRLGGSSLEVHYQIIDNAAETPQVTVKAITTLVLVDRNTMRPVRMSAEAREAAKPWTDEPLVLTR